MRYYIIAGEASGDLHGSYLIRELHKQDDQANIRCWGGDKMQAAGAYLVKHYSELAFMGFIEVIAHLRTIMRNLELCKADILSFRPDVLVLIDYPGFNMRIAKWGRQQRIPIAYYISPQVWAWKEGRVEAIRRDVDKMLVILPFEKEYYNKWEYNVTYVGHPLVEVIEDEKRIAPAALSPKPIIALLPGSRKQEISAKLPVMLSMVAHFPDYQFIVAQAPAQPDDLYVDLVRSLPVMIIKNDTYNILKQSVAALVTSGTATLETALFGVPQVVCYKGSRVSYWLARKRIKVKYISLVNLIMDKPVVKELIQGELTETNLQAELSRLLSNSHYRIEMISQYARLWQALGSSKASAAAAREIISMCVEAAG